MSCQLQAASDYGTIPKRPLQIRSARGAIERSPARKGWDAVNHISERRRCDTYPPRVTAWALKALLGGPLQSHRLRRCIRRAIRQTIEAVDRGGPADLNQGNHLRISRLEADRGSGGNIQPHPVRRSAVEPQRAIHFEKMEMRTNLDGTVACIGNFQ